jgi:hypothetical protein
VRGLRRRLRSDPDPDAQTHPMSGQHSSASIRRLAAALACCAVAACQAPPVTRQEMASVDYGPAPTQWQQTIRAWLNRRLVDAPRAIVEFKTEPRVMFQRATAVRGQQYGWAVCVWINDRNWSGEFDGFYPMTFFLRNEQIVAVNNGPEDFGIIGAQYARRQCAELGAPFVRQ